MKKRGLISAIAMLVVSAIVLTSATMAWFSMGKTVTVNSFTVDVTKADGLQISANGSDFGPSLNLADIKTATTEGKFAVNDIFSPVSSNGISAFIGGQIDENGLSLTSENVGGYYQFPVWIKYGGSSNINISLAGTTVTANAEQASGITAEKAARICIYKDTTTSASEVKVFAPNSETSESYKYASSASDTTGTALSTVVTDPSTITFGMNANSTQKFIVKVWLEGFDTQCTDEIAAGGKFDVAITFTKVGA